MSPQLDMLGSHGAAPVIEGRLKKASHYEIRERVFSGRSQFVVVPAEGATVESTDIWETYGHKKDNPHESFAQLAYHFGWGRWEVPEYEGPSDELLEDVLGWVQAYGLPGSLLASLVAFTLPPRVNGAEWVQTSWRRDGSGWVGQESTIVDLNAAVPATAILRGADASPDDRLIEYPLEPLWHIYGLPTEPFPVVPWEDDFWRNYSEPLSKILARADLLRQMWEALSEKTSFTDEQEIAKIMALRDLRNAIKDVSPDLSNGAPRLRLRWSSPSPLTSLSMMLALDLSGGGYVRVCAAEDCGRTFRASDKRAIYCCKKCKSRQTVRASRARRGTGRPVGRPRKERS